VEGPGRGGADTPAAAVAAYRRSASRKSDVERQADDRTKTGVFTGAFADQPGERQPDPSLRRRLRAHGLRHRRDHGRAGRRQRDYDFATEFDLPIVDVVAPWRGMSDWPGTTEGTRLHRRRPGDQLVSNDDVVARRAGDGRGQGEDHGIPAGQGNWRGTVNYKLRDWLFSRQRYWGEPFPVVWDEDGVAHSCPTRCCR
jgi:leucyl-tRNA synthetase